MKREVAEKGRNGDKIGRRRRGREKQKSDKRFEEIREGELQSGVDHT